MDLSCHISKNVEIYVIDLDKYNSAGFHWIALFINSNNVTYFNSSGVEYILTWSKKFRVGKIIVNIYRV